MSGAFRLRRLELCIVLQEGFCVKRLNFMPVWGKPARGPGDPGSAGEASKPSAPSGPGARLLPAPSARAEGRGQNQGSSSLPALPGTQGMEGEDKFPFTKM